jgi:hypothetical protein
MNATMVASGRKQSRLWFPRFRTFRWRKFVSPKRTCVAERALGANEGF